ncbi:MAG TPA: hypothetical protein DEA52_02720 [Clostridiaceae bacterium]|nr:hypothetical protein [Clostridiaceae bacterium]
MKTVEVVAAIIKKGNTFLCMQRGESPLSYISKKYEFPGGKVEPGEALHKALERELQEEMDVKITVLENQYFMSVNHTYPDFRILMHGYLLEVETFQFKLREHLHYVWQERESLLDLDWAPADVPLVMKLKEGA